MKRALAMAFVAFLAGCNLALPRYEASSISRETGFYDDPDTPDLALLEYRLANYFARSERPYSTVCAAAGRQTPGQQPKRLHPAVEERLLARFPDLSPLTECVVQPVGYRDADTGSAAAVFDVHDVACETPSRCTAWGGSLGNGPHGYSWFELRYRNGEWEIRRIDDLGIELT